MGLRAARSERGSLQESDRTSERALYQAIWREICQDRVVLIARCANRPPKIEPSESLSLRSYRRRDRRPR